MSWITPLLVLIALPLLLWSGLLLLEIVCAALSRPSRRAHDAGGPSYAVLIPAHNEAEVIADTLRGLGAAMDGDGRILVVADNCSDDTAQLVRDFGAEVIERHSADERGKGFALNFGLGHLSAAPPEVVILLDADCHFSRGSARQLAAAAYAAGGPLQCDNTMRFRGDEGLGRRIALFAWRVKNTLRPGGLAALGLPCQLTGTGMAFPWSVIGRVQVPSADIVEDMVLGLNLARAGDYPCYYPSVQVTSDFPDSADAERSQRDRWEHGHLQTILHTVPLLALDALARRDWRLALMCVDLSIPPLSLMALLIGTYTLVAFAAALAFSAAAPLAAAIWLCISFASAALLAWRLCACDLLAAAELFSAPLYAIKKLGIYRRFVRRRQVEWVRTSRK